MGLQDFDNAERILNRFDNIAIEKLPVIITIQRASILNTKRKHGESLKLLDRRLSDKSLTNKEKIRLLLRIAICESNLGNFDKTYGAVQKVWDILNPGTVFDIKDKSFYRLQPELIGIELIRLINTVNSYLKGKGYLNGQKYREMYEYVKKYPGVYDVYPFEETDMEFPDEKYFVFKIVTKQMSPEEAFKFEDDIETSLQSMYPDEFVLVDIVERADVSN